MLLGLAMTGAVGCLLSTAALRQMLINGTPVVCPYRGTQLKLPGRPIGALLIAIPTLALGSGFWLLTSGFRKDEESHN
jgi:hypothetical protein